MLISTSLKQQRQARRWQPTWLLIRTTQSKTPTSIVNRLWHRKIVRARCLNLTSTWVKLSGSTKLRKCPALVPSLTLTWTRCALLATFTSAISRNRTYSSIYSSYLRLSSPNSTSDREVLSITVGTIAVQVQHLRLAHLHITRQSQVSTDHRIRTTWNWLWRRPSVILKVFKLTKSALNSWSRKHSFLQKIKVDSSSSKIRSTKKYLNWHSKIQRDKTRPSMEANLWETFLTSCWAQSTARSTN